MKKISLQFKDVLMLLEFVAVTQKHFCPIDSELAIITCDLSDAEIELALNGYKAAIVCSV